MSNIRAFVSFLSSSGNGHSLVSSLLDAHRNVTVSRERQVLKRLIKNKEVEVKDMFEDIIAYSVKYTEKGRPHNGTGTSHLVPNQFNGFPYSYPLLVIGDKHGFGTAKLIAQPNNLRLLERRLHLPIYFLHIHRNPFDTIAHLSKFYTKSLDQVIETVGTRLAIVDIAMKKAKRLGKVLSFSIEDFVSNYRSYVRKVLRFLALEPYRGYIRDCSKVLRPDLLNERCEINWTNEQIDKITAICDSFSYLRCSRC